MEMVSLIPGLDHLSTQQMGKDSLHEPGNEQIRLLRPNRGTVTRSTHRVLVASVRHSPSAPL